MTSVIKTTKIHNTVPALLKVPSVTTYAQNENFRSVQQKTVWEYYVRRVFIKFLFGRDLGRFKIMFDVSVFCLFKKNNDRNNSLKNAMLLPQIFLSKIVKTIESNESGKQTNGIQERNAKREVKCAIFFVTRTSAMHVDGSLEIHGNFMSGLKNRRMGGSDVF